MFLLHNKKCEMTFNGSTTVGIQHQGQEIEGLTQATIGHGTLNIADGSGADVNRDINTVEIILRDETTGAIDSTLTVDHRLFSESGRTKMVKEMADLPDNMRNMSGNFVQEGYNLSENSNSDIVKGFTFLYNTVVGSIGGVVGTFYEKEMTYFLNGKIISKADVGDSKVQEYKINGILTSEEEIRQRSLQEKNAIMAYNRSYGLIGDLFESGVGKAVQNSSTLSGIVDMNRQVSQDLWARKDIENAKNTAHSQGTIITLGAMAYLGKNAKDISNSQAFIAWGPAVSKDDWIEVFKDKSKDYVYNINDPVRCFATIDCIKQPSLFKGLLKNGINGHSYDSYRKKQ